MKQTILIVDDYKDTRELMGRALGDEYSTVLAPDAEAAMKALAADPSIALMLSDVRMPGTDGVTLLKTAKATYPELAVIILTAYGTVDLAVEAMKDGADDFLTKPVDLDQLELRVKKVLETRRLKTEVADLHRQLDEKYGLENIVGESPAMKNVFRRIRQAAPSDATVLISGPSGTGKELVAHAIHRLSNRSRGPFVAVECAALAESLLESELFGHEKGAFTGAVARRIGRFEAADGGTIFLDEISEISPAIQVKLLRVLESRTFQRVGSSETIKTDIRLVAATNRNLAQFVAEGKFREDLFYRLNVVDIHMPALRERPGDIALLAARFIREFSAANGGRVTGITPAALKLLEAYSWPGNVRELRNTIEKMVVLSPGGELDVQDVPDQMQGVPAPMPPAAGGTLGETEKMRILAGLREANGNRSLAAKILGISRRTLYRKLDEYLKEGNPQ
jgi:DNA-binding NtrC family response regulator